MMYPTPCVFDTLESRTLLSGGHSQAVVSDKAQIAIDVKLLHSHSKMHQAKVHRDQAAIHHDMARIKSATKQHVKADMAAFNKILKADRNAITTTHKLELKLIAADKVKIRSDSKAVATVHALDVKLIAAVNPTIPAVHADATLLAQDEAQLQLDEQKMNDDLAAEEDQLQADENQETSVTAADEQEGQDELNGTDPTLQADKNQLNQDDQAERDDQQNDNNQLNSDETKLQVDIEAEANVGHHG